MTHVLIFAYECLYSYIGKTLLVRPLGNLSKITLIRPCSLNKGPMMRQYPSPTHIYLSCFTKLVLTLESDSPIFFQF